MTPDQILTSLASFEIGALEAAEQLRNLGFEQSAFKLVLVFLTGITVNEN